MVLNLETKQKKGGKVRAEKLSAERRKEISSMGVSAKLQRKTLPKEIDSGVMEIGNTVFKVAVLENELRIVNQTSVFEAMGRPSRGYKTRNVFKDTDILIPPFMDAANLLPYTTKEIIEYAKPIEYMTNNNTVVSGYDARILPEVCQIYMDAGMHIGNTMTKNQLDTVKKASILLKGLATVGIIALVDEATGYEKRRAAKTLSKILETYLHKELRSWTKVFDVDFYEELYRVHGFELTVKTAKNGDKYTRTGHFAANFTNDIIYDRLIPGVELRTVLKEKTKGKYKDGRAVTQHQGLKEDKIPKLKEHLAAVKALLKVSKNKDEFYIYMNKAFPKIIDIENVS